jgi:hypothetical protein
VAWKARLCSFIDAAALHTLLFLILVCSASSAELECCSGCTAAEWLFVLQNLHLARCISSSTICDSCLLPSAPLFCLFCCLLRDARILTFPFIPNLSGAQLHRGRLALMYIL